LAKKRSRLGRKLSLEASAKYSVDGAFLPRAHIVKGYSVTPTPDGKSVYVRSNDDREKVTVVRIGPSEAKAVSYN